jgi:hypothetical protein
VKSGRLNWIGDVTRMGQINNSHKILEGNVFKSERSAEDGSLSASIR